MLIKCPECQHDNQLGAIFCRNCGAKLDIEKIRPEVKDQRIGLNIFGLIRRIFFIGLLLAIVLIILGLFLPYGLKEYQEPSEDVMKSAKEKLERLQARLEGGQGVSKYIFSPEEATVAFNTGFIHKVEGEPDSGYAVDKVIFDITTSGKAAIIMDAKLGGKLSSRFEIDGVPEVTAGEGDAPPTISFNIESAKMGHVPMVGETLKSKIAEKYSAVSSLDSLAKLRSELRNIEIDENGSFVITLAEPKPDTSKKKKK